MNNYVIFFTPRSGSSWLTQMLVDSKVLGKPYEWFNPEHIDTSMRSLGVKTVEDYLRALIEKKASRNGVFGVELTSIHYDKFLKDSDSFKNFLFEKPKILLLLRQDIIAQAVSLWKAVESGVFHSVEGKPQKELEFDAFEIKKWVRHILAQERRLAEIFKELNVSPIKITYEFLVSNPKAVISLIGSGVVDVNYISMPKSENSYKKLADNNSNDLVSMFYKKNHIFCSEVFKERANIGLY